MSNEQNTQAGANFLTNDQIAAGAAIECDHGAPIGRNVAIDVFDAMHAAAPVAAQAGQVAVPEDAVLTEATDALRQIADNGGEAGKTARAALHVIAAIHKRAAAPSAPAVAQQASVDSIDTPGVRALLAELAAWGGAGGMVKANEFVGRAAAAIRAPAQASTPDVRQEQQS